MAHPGQEARQPPDKQTGEPVKVRYMEGKKVKKAPRKSIGKEKLVNL